MKRLLIFVIILLSFTAARAQYFIDSCFSSPAIQSSFPVTATVGNTNADLIQWNGTNWGPSAIGSPTLPPPTSSSGCRAIWMGHGTLWTTGGEGFSLQMTSPLVVGQSYTLVMTYVSNGSFSNGSFSPQVWSGNNNNVPGSFLIGNLPSAGNAWVTNSFTFTAAAAQAGHNWISFFTGPTGSSGMILSQCYICTGVPLTPACGVNLGPDTTLCNSQSITLNVATPNAVYLWQDGSTASSFTVTQPGLYWVEINTATCYATDTVNVNYVPAPVASLGNDTTLCGASSLLLDAGNPGSTYLWSTGATTQTISAGAGIYHVTVSNASCSDIDSISITTYSPPDIGSDTSFCEGPSIALGAAGTYNSYTWSTGASTPNINVSSTGVYWLTVTSGPCTFTDSINIAVVPLPVVDLGNDTSLCPGGAASITLDAGNPLSSYLWSTGAATQTIDIISSGTYFVIVANEYNCTSSDTIMIAAPQLLELGEQSLCEHPQLTLNAEGTGSSYLWSTGETTPFITVSDPGIYWVTSASGSCVQSDTIDLSEYNSGLYFANTFTPNHDGLNEIFTGTGEDIATYELKIFNRWGELFFTSDNIIAGWDGTYKGRPVSQDVYVWVVDYTLSCTGTKKHRKIGHVLVLR